MGRAAALQLSIRNAGPRDAAAVASLLGQLGYPCDVPDAEERIATVANDLDQLLLIGEADGVIAGLVALDVSFYLPLGTRTARITALVVCEHLRRRGVGSALLREAQTRARAAGAARIELTSATSRVEAHRFYLSAGFAESALRFLKHLGDA